jgi:hypothetical protein
VKIISILSFVLLLNLFSAPIDIVPIAKKPINYKTKIFGYDVLLVQSNNKYRCKKYLDLTALKKNQYMAKHYIGTKKPICLKDVYIASSKKVKFVFGNLEIEKAGEIIKETDRYIKIKNIDGKIEKIYKNGLN